MTLDKKGKPTNVLSMTIRELGLRWRGSTALFLAGVITASALSIFGQKVADYSQDGRGLHELAAEAKRHGLSTVIVNRAYTDSPRDPTSLPEMLKIDLLVVQLLERVSVASGSTEFEFDIMTLVKMTVEEDLTRIATGKNTRGNYEPPAQTLARLQPFTASQRLLAVSDGGSINIDGVTLTHQSRLLDFLKPGSRYLINAEPSAGKAWFIESPLAVFEIDSDGHLTAFDPHSPLAMDVARLTGNTLAGVKRYVAAHRSAIPKYHWWEGDPAK